MDVPKTALIHSFLAVEEKQLLVEDDDSSRLEGDEGEVSIIVGSGAGSEASVSMVVVVVVEELGACWL